jgi:signal transduction histidine kinase
VINIHSIQTATEAMVRLVQALKSYARLDQARLERVDLRRGLEETLAILKHEIKEGIEVETDFAPLPEVECYAGELNQVWTNLILNALQAMAGTGRLSIVTYQQDGFAGVRITDTGPGIPPEALPRIFDPFFTTKGPGLGSGLGLGIVRQIVEHHRGRLNVTSRPGCTQFDVLLPFRPEGSEPEITPPSAVREEKS